MGAAELVCLSTNINESLKNFIVSEANVFGEKCWRQIKQYETGPYVI